MAGRKAGHLFVGARDAVPPRHAVASSFDRLMPQRHEAAIATPRRFVDWHVLVGEPAPTPDQVRGGLRRDRRINI
jgi:hypothetical protein